MKRLAATLVAAFAVLAPSASAATTTTEAPTRSTRVNGATLAYRVIGERGTPIVLVTGYAVTMDEWDPAFVDRLARKHRVVLFDNRAAGRSKGATDDLSIEQMAADTDGLIRKLKLKKPHVAGWSMGGMIVQALAIGHPQSVGSIGLLTTATGGPGTPALDPVVVQRLAPAHSQDDLWDLNFSSRAAYRAYTKRRDVRRRRSTISAKTQTAQFLATGRFLAETNSRAWDALPDLDVPTIVLDGTLDTVFTPANNFRVAARIPGAIQIDYPRLKHAFMFQKPTQVADRLIAFIRSVR